MAAPGEVRILGPLEVVGPNGTVALGARRQRIVLAMLALNANRVIGVEQLVDAVWDTDPPVTARSQIQTCVSALRKMLSATGGPAEISTRPPGYVLEIDDDHLDSKRFNTLVGTARQHEQDGRLTEALAELRAALALWRGPVLADVPSDLVRRLSAGLSERRVSAEVARLRIELALGRHVEIVPDLQALVAEHPLREELYGHLMLALYRSGRQTEALETYRRARAVLVEEVGLEPSAELSELERAILNRDRNLDPPVGGPVRTGRTGGELSGPLRFVVPGQLPAAIADFTGREPEIAEIVESLSWKGDTPFVPVIAISGRGGIGKSALAVQAAHRLREHFPDGQLYADLSHEWADRGVDGVLERFLRALGIACSAIPEDAAERADLYRSWLAGRRVLVVLDDVVSEEQATSLLPGTAGCAAIVTSRSRLGGLPGARLIDLAEFEPAQSRHLLTRIVGTERVGTDPAATDELVRSCEGLPLALRIAGARLVSKPHWTVSDLVSRLADESRMLDEFTHGALEIRSNVGLSYRTRPPLEQRLFRLLSLIDANEFPAWAAAALLDTDIATSTVMLENLVDAQLVAVNRDHGRMTTYGFHRLIRAYAREQLMAAESAEERDRAVERWLGAWLARVEQVHRRQYGGDYTVLHGKALRWHPPGYDRGSSDNGLVTLEGERRMLVAAIRQAAEAGWDELCWDLCLTSMTLFEARGYYDDWREAAQLAREAVERAGNRRGRAAVHYALGALHLARKKTTEASRELLVALELFTDEGDEHGRGLALRHLAFVDRLHGDAPAMLVRYNEALTILRTVGDRMGEAHVLCNLAKHWLAEGEEDRAWSLLREALAISIEAGCLRGEAQALSGLAYFHIARKEPGQADSVLNEALRVVHELRDTTGEAHVLYGIGLTRLLEGRAEHAEFALTHAVGRAREAGERQIETQALYQLGRLFMARDEITAASRCCAEALVICEELAIPLLTARILLLASEISTARGAFALARVQAMTADEILAGLPGKEARQIQTELQGQWPVLRGAANSNGSSTPV